MPTTWWSVVHLLCIGVYFVARVAPCQTSRTFLRRLFELTSQEQVKQDVPFIPYKQWEKTKGLYGSSIKLNFHGGFWEAESRRLIDVFDNNMFVTAWVTSSLLEAFKYGPSPRPSEEQLILSLQVLKEHQDKNEPYNTSTMSFWSQKYNSTTKFWECVPANVLGFFQMADQLPWRLIEAILKFMGLGDLAKTIESILSEQDTFLRAFHIPPDFDDTFVNLGLGALLYDMKDQFTAAWSLWSSHNSNITSVFDALKRYAYKPFSNNAEANSIDPRTYFHIRHFLDQAKANGQDVMLVPSWMQSIQELRKEYYLGVAMPFNINNVDVTIAANVVFGITSAVLSGLLSPTVLEDPIIAQIYHNTSALIAFEIYDNFTGRPDLALTYYPPRCEFYWFVARTVAAMDAALRKRPLPLEVMKTVYKTLRDAVEGPMTKYIISTAKMEAGDKVYFDDFLGDGDMTHGDRPLVRGEDRIFTTAMAVNALLSTWTSHDSTTGKSYWKPGTPDSVHSIASGCVNWLRQHTLDGNFDPWNAFFSGSVKSFEALPFWYPGNRLEYLNGTAIHNYDDFPNATFLYAAQGYIPAKQYTAMLMEKHFGVMTPLTFHGYNNGSAYFPLWSSAPYTYSTTLLAVARFENIVG